MKSIMTTLTVLAMAGQVSFSAKASENYPSLDSATEASLTINFDKEISKQEAQIRAILTAIKSEKSEVDNEAMQAKQNPVKLTLISKKNSQ